MSYKICKSLNCCNAINFDEQNHIDFSHVGGLSEHIRILRELIIFPLIYKDVYAKFNIRAPRGVLFYGPPGTGKTLVAQALANECSKSTQLHVSFFYRKGSDILDKWVGESEKNLRSIFETAANAKPSIIFFDEIDALAPTRSSFQDQVHSSVVATLLSLMDGLESVNGIIVIGATNRLNAIDSALRRTGRFDRELYFPLPNRQARLEILQVIIKSWTTKPSLIFLNHLADITSGCCGSDLQSLCSNAVLCCLKRNYPEIHSESKTRINLNALEVLEEDFIAAQKTIIPASRKFRLYQYRLSEVIKPLLIKQFLHIINLLESTWPHFLNPEFRYENGVERYSGRLVILGNVEQGHKEHLAPALLHYLEHLPIHILDIQTLYEPSGRFVEEIFVQKFRQIQQCCPCVAYIPGIDLWWEAINNLTKALFLSLLFELNTELPVLFICTSQTDMPQELFEYFSMKHSQIVRMRNPDVTEREQFFASLFLNKTVTGPLKRKIRDEKCDRLILSSGKSKRLRRSRRLTEKSVVCGPKRRKRFNLIKSNHVVSNCNQSETGSKQNVDDSKIVATSSKSNDKIQTDKNTFENCIDLPNVEELTGKENKTKNVENNNVTENLGSDEQKLEISNEPMRVEINRSKLKSLFNRLIKHSTENATCVKLELLYDKFDTCITSYVDIWDRNPMLEKIENILECYEKEYLGPATDSESN